jgi:replicative DNA helicase
MAKDYRKRRSGGDDLPPHSVEAEQGLLGCILLAPSVLDDALLVIQTPDYFYDLRNRTVWESLIMMQEQQIDTTVVALVQFLKDTNSLEAAGGYPYLSELPEKTPAASNSEYFLKILREKYILRSLLKFSVELTQKVRDSTIDVDGLIDSEASKFYQIAEERVSSAFTDSKQLVDEAMEVMDNYVKVQGHLRGTSTGLVDLDKLTGGLMDGEMIILGGRPGCGKTSLAVNIAEHALIEEDKSVGIFSMEMAGTQLMMRMISSRAKVNLRHLQDGFMAERDAPRLIAAAGKLRKTSLYIDDDGGLTLNEFRAKSRILVQKYQAKLIILDYIQLMTTGSRNENRNQELSQISMGIKNTAKKLKVPIIVLSQLNRELDKSSREPRLSDLRDCGGLESDADTVMFLYRPGKNGSEEGGDTVPVTLSIAKQRNGPVGGVNLVFLKGLTRFEQAAKITEEDVPEQDNLPYKD